ncbi:MAG: class I SAM-dependent methyltransferase [Flavobacteriales bacterium]|nr:class I SAM-dependent methyltransferase [Flavobacteriales bacterium]MDG1781879.1 class I SAM-dependent methyltransferase [Flavobacteriales bacterium]MDG2246888.1 class I SAM-dependent methyltransferase [Flavobacteriales bacterium]
MQLESLLKDYLTAQTDENPLVFNLLTEADTAKFYSDMYSEGFEPERPALYQQNKKEFSVKDNAHGTMSTLIQKIKTLIPEDGSVIELGGSVYQKRSGNAVHELKNYFPLDISYSSMARYANQFNRQAIVADATILPFKDKSVDCFVTHTFLEHPHRPDLVLEEVHRSLRPGGIVVHNDAWFCRWWHRFGIVGLKPWSDMNFKEKMVYNGYKITEFKLIRIPPIIIKRFLKDLFAKPKYPIKLSYKKLKPNYDLHLMCDEDAATSIDPVDVIRFYESRGYQLIEPLTFKERLFLGNRWVGFRKKDETNQSE